MIKRIVVLAIALEIIGTIVFTLIFLSHGHGFGEALGLGAFHAISSYNNAGVDIFAHNDSLMNYSNDYIFNVATMILMLLGSLGTIVIFDVFKNKRWSKLSYHSKIVLKMMLIIFVFGSLSFFLVEKDASVLQSLFHASSVGNAGFITFDYKTAQNTTKIIMLLLMYIGGGPASTSGGVKVTTIYTLYKTSIGMVFQKEPIAYQRKIPIKYKRKAFLIFMFSLLIIVISLITISLLEPQKKLLSLVFEVVSAFSNSGLNLGTTAGLNALSKMLLMILMFIGRIGILTFVSLIGSTHREKHSNSIDYIDIEYLM